MRFRKLDGTITKLGKIPFEQRLKLTEDEGWVIVCDRCDEPATKEYAFAREQKESPTSDPIDAYDIENDIAYAYVCANCEDQLNRELNEQDCKVLEEYDLVHP